MQSKSELTKMIAAMVILLLAACGPAQTQSGSAAAQTAPPAADPASTHAAYSLSSAFRVAAQHALPAVVYVRVEKSAEAVRRDGQGGPDPFRFFFGQPPEGAQIPPQVGSGSGFIFDHEGHVITNHHVVAGADYVLVRLTDGREYRAEVVGSDPATDVAVLKLDLEEGGKLPAADIGLSAPLEVGDWVLALGSPFELESTVTAGIVSAKRRQLTRRPTALESFIQTDAAINPGNSGGPLVDLEGRVVGINTAILGGPSWVGYGFAIPIDLAKKVIDDLLEFGAVKRPLLGVQVSDVTAVDAEVYGLDSVRGADIASISPGTPAARAGLKPGDVVVALDGQPIEDASDLTTQLAERRPGDEVELTFLRDKRERRVAVELAEFESGQPTPAEPRQASHEVEQTLGFRVERLTPEIAASFEIEGHDNGVVITDVTPFSPAAYAGIAPGMVLLRVNGQGVDSPADVRRIAETVTAGRAVSLLVDIPGTGETIINFRVRG